MTRSKKWLILSLLAVAAVVVLLLAAGLPQLALAPGQPFLLARPSSSPFGLPGLGLSAAGALAVFVRGFVALALVLLPFYILFNLLTPEGRRRLLRQLILLAWLLLGAVLLTRTRLGWLTAVGQTGASGQVQASDPSSFEPTQAANWTIWLSSLCLAILASAAIVLVYWLYRRRQEQLERLQALERLARPAQEAIQALRQGGEVKDIIIRCYVQMSQVARETRGLQRDAAMTASEFVQVLAAHGLPAGPVQQLTRLFEAVRYSDAPASSSQQQAAVACLGAILDACQGAAPARG